MGEELENGSSLTSGPSSSCLKEKEGKIRLNDPGIDFYSDKKERASCGPPIFLKPEKSTD